MMLCIYSLFWGSQYPRFVVDLDDRASLAELGKVSREVMRKNFLAMAL
jgi:hypothetical protein